MIYRFMMLCVILLAFPIATATAVDIRSDSTVNYSQANKVNDDIVTAGNEVSIGAAVAGDVAAAGSTVTISGNVRDSALLAGGTVTTSGRIGNDAWIAGGDVNLNGPVADNAYLAGGNVTVAKGSRVAKDLQAAGGTVNVQGDVGRNLRIGGGDITIGGTVGGDVNASAGESLRLTRGAVIRGDLIYQSPVKVKIDPGAKVLGEIRYHPTQKQKQPAFGFLFFFKLMGLLAAILFGIVLLLLFPIRTLAAADTAATAFLPSFGIGVLVFIVTPIALGLIAMTVVGIPLSLAVLAVYLVLLYAAKIFAGIAVGRWIFVKLNKPAVSVYWAMIVGLVIFMILELIPFIGGLVWFIVLMTGLGAFLINWWRSRPAPATAATPAVQPTPEPGV
jgi:cytoskeletal protein CcmA (bactofilin family)